MSMTENATDSLPLEIELENATLKPKQQNKLSLLSISIAECAATCIYCNLEVVNLLPKTQQTELRLCKPQSLRRKMQLTYTVYYDYAQCIPKTPKMPFEDKKGSSNIRNNIIHSLFSQLVATIKMQGTLLMFVSDSVFYNLSHGTFSFAFHGSFWALF